MCILYHFISCFRGNFKAIKKNLKIGWALGSGLTPALKNYEICVETDQSSDQPSNPDTNFKMVCGRTIKTMKLDSQSHLCMN